MIAPLRVTVRTLCILLFFFFFMPPFLVAEYWGKKHWHEWFLRFSFRSLLRIMGISVAVEGEEPVEPPALLVANHASYLDIFAAGAILPLRFTPKREAADWPVISFLINRSHPLYIDRANRAAIRAQQEAFAGVMREGDNILLFPEGTTSDGNRVLPFKSALFSTAEQCLRQDGQPIPVQPLTITYTHMAGKPAGEAERRLLAWYDDMALIPHLFRVFSLPRSTITLHFHRPTDITEHASRKELAAHCEAIIREQHQVMMRGNP